MFIVIQLGPHKKRAREAVTGRHIELRSTAFPAGALRCLFAVLIGGPRRCVNDNKPVAESIPLRPGVMGVASRCCYSYDRMPARFNGSEKYFRTERFFVPALDASSV